MKASSTKHTTDTWALLTSRLLSPSAAEPAASGATTLAMSLQTSPTVADTSLTADVMVDHQLPEEVAMIVSGDASWGNSGAEALSAPRVRSQKENGPRKLFLFASLLLLLLPLTQLPNTRHSMLSLSVGPDRSSTT